MSMLRSMDSAVSGLRNHQVRMDIIGNNIANVNTIGFKSGRVTFEESLTQLLKGSTRPPGDQGGTNPIQVGQGMSVGSVDTRFSQGNLESTGQVTDMAIEGDSFFAVSNGSGVYYTRNGAFQLDANGHVVLPTNGFILQGKMANQDGVFPPGTVVEDIMIPLSEQSPARATEEVTYGKNLDSDSQALGTVHNSQSFLHHTEGADLLTGLSNSSGESLGIQVGDILTFNGTSNLGGPAAPVNYTVTATSDVNDLLTQITAYLNNQIFSAGASATLLGDGSIQISAGLADPVQDFQITSDNPLSTGRVTNAFAVSTTVAAGGSDTSDFFRSPAEATDLLSELYDAEGNSLGLEGDGLAGTSDEISIQGQIGGTAANNLPGPILYDAATTTLQDIIDSIRENFRLSQFDGTYANNPTVEVNSNSEDNIPNGAIVVRGLAGLDFALDGISIRATNDNQTNPSPANFNQNFNFNPVQNARDAKVFDTSITVFDESGDDHIMTTTFVPTQTPGVWNWEISMAGDEVPIGGNSGSLIFDNDGTVSSFTFDDNETQFSFDPNNGSSVVRIDLEVGGPGDFRGLTQFRAPTTASITGQDGYTTGALREISVSEDGMINGIFTNGVNKPLAQVMLVDFINPGGLMKISDSVFGVSNNSGDPIYAAPGGNNPSKIKPGALEISNVELALEFTEMITTQRGYQANARGITISDSMLEELVNLKR